EEGDGEAGEVGKVKWGGVSGRRVGGEVGVVGREGFEEVEREGVEEESREGGAEEGGAGREAMVMMMGRDERLSKGAEGLRDVGQDGGLFPENFIGNHCLRIIVWCRRRLRDVADWVEGFKAIACRSVERRGMTLTVFDWGDIDWYRLYGNFLFFDPLEISTSVIKEEQSCGPENCPSVEKTVAVANGYRWASTLQGRKNAEIDYKQEQWISQKMQNLRFRRSVFSVFGTLTLYTYEDFPHAFKKSVQGSHKKPDAVVYPRDVTMKRKFTAPKYPSSDYQGSGNVNVANHLPAGSQNQGMLDFFLVDCGVGFNKAFDIGAPARNTQRTAQHHAAIYHGGDRGESNLRTPVSPNNQVTLGNNNLPPSSFQGPGSFIPTTIYTLSDPSLPVFQPTGEDTGLIWTPLDRISNVSSVPQLPRRPDPQDTRSQSEITTTRSAVVPFSFGNNRGRGNRLPPGTVPQRPAENPLNRDWSRAMDQAAEALNNQEDRQLQTILGQSYYSIAPNSRPTKEEVMRNIARFLLVMSHRLEARHAAMFLAQSNWHYDIAVRNYLDQRYPDRNKATRKPRKRRAIQEQTTSRDAHLDSDEDKEIPYDLVTTIARDPERKKIVPAVYHWQIRQHLLRRDHKRYERYVYGRCQGPEKYDRTARHPDQLWWGFETRDQYPPIVFVLRPPEPPEEAEQKIESLYWRKHLVLDIDGLPIRDLPHLPSTLASTVESGLLEALIRTDTRTTHRDLRGRQPPIYPTTDAPTLRQLKNQENALAQRMR
ncbi:MAG: hypothetical protein Q9214_004255, partial [Letrouitia sp. 1 TL-2023]